MSIGYRQGKAIVGLCGFYNFLSILQLHLHFMSTSCTVILLQFHLLRDKVFCEKELLSTWTYSLYCRSKQNDQAISTMGEFFKFSTVVRLHCITYTKTYNRKSLLYLIQPDMHIECLGNGFLLKKLFLTELYRRTDRHWASGMGVVSLVWSARRPAQTACQTC